MEIRKFSIECDRAEAKELINILGKYENSKVEINQDKNSFEGSVEIISLIASLSTVATNAFLIWSERKKNKSRSLKIDEIKGLKDGDN